MEAGTLDELTLNTFQWSQYRPTATERAALGKEQGTYATAEEEEIERNRKLLEDKGRIRRIKVKVWRLLSKPLS